MSTKIIDLFAELESLGKTLSGYKPHKHILILAIINLIKQKYITNNQIYYNNLLQNEFTKLIKIYGSDNDRNRPYNPFYYLKTTSFWTLIAHAGLDLDLKKIHTIAGPTMLTKIVDYAILHIDFYGLLMNVESRTRVEEVILKCLSERKTNKEMGNTLSSINRNRDGKLNRLLLPTDLSTIKNPFVSYLNSLQRLNGSNENALAEFQACNSFFPLVHVPHPLTELILKELQDKNGRQIILTGHAGDGKSTIALNVYKRLKGIPDDQPLSNQLDPREDIDLANIQISLLKDLSERNQKDDSKLVQEIIQGARRFLIISNTGALLDLFRKECRAFAKLDVNIEKDVLRAISEEEGTADLVLGQTRFLVVNLARIDNLHLAEQIFERMIDSDQWEVCANAGCHFNCPIYLNVHLIQKYQSIIFERIFLAYRRMYEYGSRLTLRQITEHLAYILTSGLEESDLLEMREKNFSPLQVEYMFFNRFFGDNGMKEHDPAQQMRAIREIKKQRFGERPCPTWERRLWLKVKDHYFRIGIEDCEQEFHLLLKHGSGPGNNSFPGLNPDQAREQVRRMLFFLYDFQPDQRSYLHQFLNSPMLWRWKEWQTENSQLEMTEKNSLEQRIYHVLQEHFTGVRLPEGAKGQDRRLYITLSRGKGEIRQSAQVVMAQVDWNSEIEMCLATKVNMIGVKRTDLQLKGLGRIANIYLVLTLPFLDYVVMRHFGEVGEIIQAAYVERLEIFKSQILRLARESSERIMLVRLRTDHTFRRQQYLVQKGVLEVSDVL